MRARFLKFLDDLPLLYAVLFAATLGLAPFVPEPHILEKLRMLAAGTLTEPLDIFDLVFHGWTWVLLAAKLARMAMARPAS